MPLSNSDLEEISSNEQELWIPESRFHKARMTALLTSDFEEIGQSGRHYRLANILDVTPEPFETVLPLLEYTIAQISEDVALTTYISKVTYSSGTVVAKRSSLWCKQHGKWLLRFHQGTPLHE